MGSTAWKALVIRFMAIWWIWVGSAITGPQSGRMSGVIGTSAGMVARQSFNTSLRIFWI
jgi:hypothetical protein